MSFQEKSNWVMLVALGLAGAWYFGDIAGALATRDFTPGAIGRDFIVMTVAIVLVAVPAQILVAMLNPSEADEQDERDRLIEMRADARSSYVLGAGAIFAINLAIFGIDVYWVANAVLAALLLAEIAKAVLRAVDYRRGV